MLVCLKGLLNYYGKLSLYNMKEKQDNEYRKGFCWSVISSIILLLVEIFYRIQVLCIDYSVVVQCTVMTWIQIHWSIVDKLTQWCNKKYKKQIGFIRIFVLNILCKLHMYLTTKHTIWQLILSRRPLIFIKYLAVSNLLVK